MFSTLLLALSSAFAQEACDPATYSEDPAAFADLAVQDFESLAETPMDWSGTSTLVIDDLEYSGIAWITNDWCIPGMDSAVCGGDNQYLASPVDLTITPLEPTSRIGFRYGSQGDWMDVTVTLSDGSVQSFTLDGDGSYVSSYPGYEPAVGFFGYCAGDLTITSIHLSAGDGGIDDVRVGLADAPDPEPTCDADGLEAQIVGLGLDVGLENALLSKLDAAEAALDRDRTVAAVAILHAMAFSIEAQAGKALTFAEADALISCIDAWLAEIEG
jgi:hypothetical protein